MKKIVTIIVALFLIFRIAVFDTYALSVAPIFGEVLVELFGGLLVGSGAYTAEEVSDMSWNECKSALDSGLSSGTINPADVTGSVTLLNGDGSQTTVQANFLEYVDYLTNPETEVVASDLLLYGNPSEVLQDTVSSIFNMSEIKANWVNGLKTSDVSNVRTMDLQGGTCVVKVLNADGSFYLLYGSSTGVVLTDETNRVYIEDCFKRAYHKSNGALVWEQDYSGSIYSNISNGYTLYGDWVYSDGTIAETEATEVAEVGETEDGETVTLEDIQSGAVSLDDTTLDYDSFNDEAIIDLLNDILAKLDTVPVVEEDTSTYDDAKENIQAAVGELDIAELNNLQMPLGILDVFPFCLPFDFVRGMKLLSAEPETPYFEVNIVVPSFLGVPEQKLDFAIDFEMLEPVAVITRWTSLLAFSYVLIFISTKIVKGAGA